VVAELVARASGSRADALLPRALASPSRDVGPVMVEALAAAVGRRGDRAGVARALALAVGDRHPRAARGALLSGLARGSEESRAPLQLGARPAALLALAAGPDSVLADAVRRVQARLDWPGRPGPAADALRPLTDAETARIAAGRAAFGNICAACHQLDGAGAPGVAASLVGSAYVNGPPRRLIRIVLQGKEGVMLMPPVGATLSDEQLASILSYIRREWGNAADPVDAAYVKEIRGETTGRRRAWTDEELARINR